MTFRLTAKQQAAQVVVSGDAMHCMLFGGSRSGKTLLLTRNTVVRAIKAPRSRHCIFRFRLAHIKSSVVLDTFPKVMSLAFPGVEYDLKMQDLYATFENGSQLWFAGLDDKERTEKVLGQEFATLYFNECSQIPQASVDIAMTRLAQKVVVSIKGRPDELLRLRAYYDCNPPSQSHWTFQKFIRKLDSETKLALPNPQAYTSMQINPGDNEENLSPEYLDTLRNMSARMRKRFLEGNFADANPNALFPESDIDKWRVLDGAVPPMVRVVVAVDPSGADDVDNADNDEIGIVAVGLGQDGNAYVMEDNTIKAGPATWGKVATTTFDRLSADAIVGEVNFGGAMVQQTIQVARPRTPFIKVTASRGKIARAEPFSALYEAGKVRHVGIFPRLEDELAGFSTSGYTGSRSPNRADALIWALAALFPAITSDQAKRAPVVPIPSLTHYARR